MTEKEAKARIKINKLLEEAGWRFFNSPEGKANILLENNIIITKNNFDDFGEDFEKSKKGFIDFLLLDENGKPFVVLEAKSGKKNPLDGKEQARRYANSIAVRLIILSNGDLHYFWDIEYGNPEPVTKLPSYASLVDKYQKTNPFKPDADKLVNEPVGKDFIAVGQKFDYKEDPRWHDENLQAEYITEAKLKFLRQYQINAVKSLQKAVSEGRTRFLFEMATGTGKTLVSAAVIRLFLKTGNAKRVLFLVDRIELEDQAKKSFDNSLKPDHKCVIFKENKDDWHRADIVVTTIQSIMHNDKYKDIFSPSDFDLVISDEAHRSIGGNSRAVFEYFLGYKLGLTATPKNYLKNVDQDKLAVFDPKKLEMRQLLDTYITFGCDDYEPTFRYSLLDGVKEGFLVNPIVVDARTDITTEFLSEKGYAIVTKNTEGEDDELVFFDRDYEKKLFSDKTNHIFCQTFIERALKDPISGEIGKTICFCVSQNHASKITAILNKMAFDRCPDKYNSDFAVQVTSSVSDAQQFTKNFSNNNLRGHTNFLNEYESSKTRVCVTVGMMTTGYDCEDILNLCMMRPIFSPTDFVQIKGRGTRKHDFREDLKDRKTKQQCSPQPKDKFKLFDFFANCEYFEVEFDYDEILNLPAKKGEGKGGTPPPPHDEYENRLPDPLKTVKETPVGYDGMKIDRKLYETLSDKAVFDKRIENIYFSGNIKEAEREFESEYFNKPEDYLDIEKIRTALNIDRKITTGELLDLIYGKKKIKSKDELLESESDKFISIFHPEYDKIHIIKKFLMSYISDKSLRNIIDSKNFTELSVNSMITMDDIRNLKDWKDKIVEYVKTYVNLDKFAS